MPKNNTSGLPKNWRVQVVQNLAQQGLELSKGQVSDLLRGKIKNADKLSKVVDALAVVKKNHQIQRRNAERHRKMASNFFLT